MNTEEIDQVLASYVERDVGFIRPVTFRKPNVPLHFCNAPDPTTSYSILDFRATSPSEYLTAGIPRLVVVKRPHRDGQGNLQTPSNVGIITYDGLGRRIVKQIGDGNSSSHEMGDWDCTCHDCDDGQPATHRRGRRHQ